jgi:hypothetical protein
MTINILAKAFYAAAGHRPVDPAFEKKGVEHQQYELRVQRMDTRFDARLRKLFAAARPHWKGTVAARNQEEYWAAGVTAYFDGSGGGQAPLGAPRPITTRETLKAFDPGLYRLVDETMAYGERVDWRFRPFCGGAK